ncbi:Peptidase-S9 domain-containing protein [Mycena sanguinolenta]|uniref:Peptidase-S9 domain-containing protein n=1 Tax=Mycena sanguinolenta TaxID=230812 RepID=A0A8H7D762_9AGAR|nr:Peptidase-S9 domain-containing protein [Mycena sanguinolenta]
MSLSPYGTWKSPITARNITQGSVKLTDVVVDRATNITYHVESRPSESGRSVLVESHSGRDIVGKQWNVRTGVHEYGGGPAIVHAGVAYFSHFTDGRVYAVDVEKGSEPRAVTPESKVLRFANFDVHPKHSHLLVSILEDHSDSSSPISVVNTLCIINTKSQTLTPLVSGADFYASPKFSPDGTRVVWQQWFLPDMPWQGAEILVADVLIEKDKLEIRNTVHIAGQKTTHSVSYPAWATNSTIVFTSDKSGYQNPWKYELEASPVFSEPLNQDFGEPAWLLGRPPFAILDDSKRALFSAFQDGRSVLYLVDLKNGTRQPVDSPYVWIQTMQCTGAGKVVFLGDRVDVGPQLVVCTINPDSSAHFTSLSKPPDTPGFPSSMISVGQPMTLKAAPDGRPVHIVYYPPTNPEYSGSSIPGEKPPCATCSWRSHGPHRTRVEHDDPVLYVPWMGVARRKFLRIIRIRQRFRLAGHWGIVDIEDCIQAAKIISHAPYDLIDPERICIRGGSSGGYTALGAVSMGSDLRTFAAATSCYGISDLRLLMDDTHKFESGYGHRLMGGTNAEIPEVYKDRSPILQGDIDKVVPKEQAEVIFESIQRRGGVIEYKLYPGEGHGWRKEENMVDALERELAFYEKMLKIKAEYA